MADPDVSWVSRLLAAHRRGELTGVEVWDLILDHLDDPAADRLVDGLLGRLRLLVAGRAVPIEPPPVAEAEEPIVVAEDEPELLAG